MKDELTRRSFLEKSMMATAGVGLALSTANCAQKGAPGIVPVKLADGEKLRVAILGCGARASAHIGGINHNKDKIEVVALCDLVQEKMENRKKLIKRVCQKLSKMDGLLDFVTSKAADYSEAELQACNGVKKKTPDGDTLYYVRRKWIMKWCKTKAQLNIVIEHFAERGQLQPGSDGELSQQRHITGIEKRWRYLVFTEDAASFKCSW